MSYPVFMILRIPGFCFKYSDIKFAAHNINYVKIRRMSSQCIFTASILLSMPILQIKKIIVTFVLMQFLINCPNAEIERREMSAKVHDLTLTVIYQDLPFKRKRL